MDNMLEHPGTELQLLIKEKGLTQKAFASILGKKVSEVNELLKGKRNITIQRDYLLHQTLGTPIKYWILKQIDYDYSLLDIEETPHDDVILSDSLSSGAGGKSTSQQTNHSERSEESIGANPSFGTELAPLSGVKIQENIKTIDSSTSLRSSLNDNTTQNCHSEALAEESTSHETSHSEPEGRENPSNITPMDFSLQSKGQEKPEDEVQVDPLDKEEKEEIGNNSKDDEDFKKRAKIFKSF